MQALGFTYDLRGNLASRADALQPQNPLERFRYDALERLTCAYFSVQENPSAPCAISYGYAPDGNLTLKSDVGVLSYDDPAHPHAVTGAGGDSFGPTVMLVPGSGTTVRYTPFDLQRGRAARLHVHEAELVVALLRRPVRARGLDSSGRGHIATTFTRPIGSSPSSRAERRAVPALRAS